MFNSHLFNNTLFNSPGLEVGDSDQDNIVFNGYSLQSSDVVSEELIQDNTPSRDYLTQSIPRDDGQFSIGDFWRNKTIRISGVLRKSTNALLEAEIDEMKRKLAVREGNLDIKIAGVIRRYVATLVSGENMFARRRGYHITFAPFDVEFKTIRPFGTLKNYTSRSLFTQTSLDLDEQINNSGNIRTKPILILNFSAANSITVIKFENNTTGEEISITENISAGDYVKFDSESKEVTVNGVAVDYSGSFPEVETGANLITITLTGTSATYTLTTKHKTSFL